MSFLQILLRRPAPSIRCSCQRYTSTKAAAAAPAGTGAVQKPPSGASKKTPHTPIPVSSCAADTVISGVNYLKGQPAVVALPDDQYPEWLWTILKPKEYPDDGPGGKAERVRRRQENKQRIKDRNFISTQ